MISDVAVKVRALPVMVAVPAALAVTLPLLLTVATFVFEDFHVTALFVAFDGVTVAFRVRVSAGFKVALVLFNVSFVTILFATIVNVAVLLFPQL